MMSPAEVQGKINKGKTAAFTLLLIYLVIYYVFIGVLSEDKALLFSDFMSPLGLIMSLCILFWALQFFSSKKTKRIWIIFILGAATYLIGDIIFTYTEIVQGKNSLASSADIWYVISAFLILIGFFLHIPHKSKYSAARSGFDVLIVMVVYLSLDIKYVLLPIMNNVVLTGAEKFAALGYPLFDIGLFMAILLLYFDTTPDKYYFKSKMLLVIAVTWFLADQIYSVEYLLGQYQSGSWVDTLWPASFIGLSIVALKSAEFHLFIPEVLETDMPNTQEAVIFNRSFFTYGVIILFLSMWCFQYYEQDPLSIGGIIVVCLLILRQYFALLENKRLMKLLIKTNGDLVEAKARIEYDLKTDYLTRLFNRRYVDVALAELQKSVKVKPSPFSVLVLDIDHFKSINDQYGHNSGDEVLKQVAAIINANIRKEDIAARWGGEEFIVILPDTGESLAYTIGERMRNEIAGNIFSTDSDQQKIRLSVSIGVAEVDSLEQDFCKVLLRADQGMYEAKYAGRNRTVIKRVG